MNSSTPFMSWKTCPHRERQCHGNTLMDSNAHSIFHSVLVFLDVNQTNEIPPLPNITLWGKRNWFAIFHNNAFALLVFVAHKLTFQLKLFAWFVSPLHCVTVVHNLYTKTNQLPARPSSVPQVKRPVKPPVQHQLNPSEPEHKLAIMRPTLHCEHCQI